VEDPPRRAVGNHHGPILLHCLNHHPTYVLGGA
jgi:hypothetical protein